MSNINIDEIKISNININSAINYIKQDKNLVKKILIFYGFALLSIIPILNIFTLCALVGYFVFNAHLRIHYKDKELSDWKNFEDLIVTGFKYIVGALAFCFVCVLIFMIIAIPCKLVFGNYSNPIIQLFGLFINILVIAAELFFIKDLKLGSFFNLNEIKQIITKDIIYFIKYILIVFLSSIVLVFASLLLGITIIGIVAIPVLMFCCYAFIVDISAQFVRNTYKIGLNVE